MTRTITLRVDRRRSIIGPLIHAGKVRLTHSAWLWREVFAALALVACIWCCGIKHDSQLLMKMTIDRGRLLQEREQFARILKSINQAYPPDVRSNVIEAL
jgi:hypothetical protein